MSPSILLLHTPATNASGPRKFPNPVGEESNQTDFRRSVHKDSIATLDKAVTPPVVETSERKDEGKVFW